MLTLLQSNIMVVAAAGKWSHMLSRLAKRQLAQQKGPQLVLHVKLICCCNHVLPFAYAAATGNISRLG